MKSKHDYMNTVMFDPRDEVEQIYKLNTNTMSDLQKTGVITQILPVESGTSKAGKDWKKAGFVIDTQSEFNNIVCFSVFGDEKVENLNKYNKEGDTVTVSFNVSSRPWEKDGKTSWFHNLDAWRIEKAGSVTPATVDIPAATEEDDLPF